MATSSWIATPWGAATLVEEVALPQQAGDKRFSSHVQLLQTASEGLVRFAYGTGGSARRGPVTLRAKDLEPAGVAREAAALSIVLGLEVDD